MFRSVKLACLLLLMSCLGAVASPAFIPNGPCVTTTVGELRALRNGQFCSTLHYLLDDFQFRSLNFDTGLSDYTTVSFNEIVTPTPMLDFGVAVVISGLRAGPRTNPSVVSIQYAVEFRVPGTQIFSSEITAVGDQGGTMILLSSRRDPQYRDFGIVSDSVSFYSRTVNETTAVSVFSVSHVPEPSTCALIGAGLGFMAWRNRCSRFRGAARCLTAQLLAAFPSRINRGR